jgi:hypothetical protein
MKRGAVKNNHTNVNKRFTVRDKNRGGCGIYDLTSRAVHCCSRIPVICMKKKTGARQGFVLGMEVKLPEACSIPDCRKEMNMATTEANCVPFFRYPSRNKYVAGAENCMRNV